MSPRVLRSAPVRYMQRPAPPPPGAQPRATVPRDLRHRSSRKRKLDLCGIANHLIEG
jgi:hypothetical protein